jgi:hypothetical protein
LDCTDVQQLTELFEWEQASYTLLPGWWRAAEPHVPTRASRDLLNAAFARLYLPIRPGKETEAVVHVLTNGGALPLTRPARAAVDATVADFRQHRENHYGGLGGVEVGEVGECPVLNDKFTCLGTWTEVIPTDGTHIEVTLSPTTSADALSTATAEAELEGQAAAAERRRAIGALASVMGQEKPRSLDIHLTDGA